MKRLKTIGIRTLDWGSNAALALLLVAVFAGLAAPHVLGWKYGILRSGSMSPAMPAGAAIVVAPAGVGDIAPGDVITYRSSINSGLLVTHRVEALTTDERGRTAFVTKGDANAHPDTGVVTGDRLMGKVIFSVPGVGYIVQQLQTTLGFVILLLLPTLLIVGMEVRELAGGVREFMDRRKGRGPHGPSGGGGRDDLPDASFGSPGGEAAMSLAWTGPPLEVTGPPVRANETMGAGVFLTLPLMTFHGGALVGKPSLISLLLVGVVVLLAVQARQGGRKRKVSA